MPNWCSNLVDFIGEPADIERLAKDFDMAEKNKVDDGFTLPCIAEVTDGYFFDVMECTVSEDGKTLYIQYQTKWGSNLQSLQTIAQHYNVSFSAEYEEISSKVYGKCLYSDGVLLDVFLSDDMLGKAYKKEEGGYSYDELDDMLDAEINKHLLAHPFLSTVFNIGLKSEPISDSRA